MMGMLQWNSGESLLNGTPLRQIPERELWQKIAYVPQAKTSVFSYTAKEMVTLGRSAHLKMFELPGAEDEKLALACMESIGILDLKDKQCNEMSGGELQMVLIARAMTSNPAMRLREKYRGHQRRKPEPGLFGSGVYPQRGGGERSLPLRDSHQLKVCGRTMKQNL